MVLSLDLDVGFNMKDGCGVVASVLTKPVYRTALTVTRYKQYPVNEPSVLQPEHSVAMLLSVLMVLPKMNHFDVVSIFT